MASNDVVPARDEDFAAFSTNFSTLLSATPTVFGVLAADATTLATLVTSFTTLLATATNPSTRTPVAVAAKDTARAVLTAEIRSLAKRIQATPSVTVAQKTSLGLNIPSHMRTPTPPPVTKPSLTLVGSETRLHAIRLVDETTPLRRARPVGAAGAEIYSFVGTPGAEPPVDLEQWRFEGLATRSDFQIQYNGPDTGKQATIVARWFNGKGEPGPISLPINAAIAA